jgi:DNA-directed RNA polymerase subunit H (RpoH/RPB5)
MNYSNTKYNINSIFTTITEMFHDRNYTAINSFEYNNNNKIQLIATAYTPDNIYVNVFLCKDSLNMENFKKMIKTSIINQSFRVIVIFETKTSNVDLYIKNLNTKLMDIDYIKKIINIKKKNNTKFWEGLQSKQKFKFKIECFTHFELEKNITHHDLQPKTIKKLNQSEIKTLMSQTQINSLDHFPKILRNDALVKYFGWDINSIIKFHIKLGGTIPEYILYRIVK